MAEAKSGKQEFKNKKDNFSKKSMRESYSHKGEGSKSTSGSARNRSHGAGAITIANRPIPSDKKVFIGLTAIYGIGISKAKKICEDAKVDVDKRVYNLSEAEIHSLRERIKSEKMIGNDLRRFVQNIINAEISIKSYKGMRYIRGLPCNGQSTRSNAKTAKKKLFL